MSVIVIYNGVRKSLKPSPGASVQSLIQECATEFSLPPTMVPRLQLKHKKVVIDPAQPWRYCNIPNNSTIDLCVISTAASAAESSKSAQPTKLAVTIDGSGSFTGVFPSSSTLLDVITETVNKNSLSPTLLEARSEVVYIGRSFPNEELSSTTLQSLGLSGQSARIQFRLLKALKSPSSPRLGATDSGATTPKSPEPASPTPSSAMEVDPQASTPTLLSASELSPNESTPSKKSSMEMDVVNNDSMPTQQQQQQQMAVPTRLPVEQAISSVMSSNFDAVTSPMMLVITKYIVNIMSDMNNDKFRSIKTANKVFQEKIALTKNHESLLYSLGFEPDTFVASINVYTNMEKDFATMKRSYDLLVRALRELNIEEKAIPVPSVDPSGSAGASQTKPVSFNPYQSTIMRTAEQPPRGSSITETKLEILQRRKRDLEGSPQDVQTMTKVLFPGSTGSSAPSAIDEDASEDSEGNNNNSTVFSKALIQRVLQSQEETPLTTAAMREVSKMEKIKIYNRTLIKVRFADNMSIQGYFHPRHTMLDIFTWIVKSLHPNITKISDESSDDNLVLSVVNNIHNILELMQPPNAVMSPSSETTLDELKFVPAAMFLCRWKTDVAQFFDEKLDRQPKSLGFYFHPDLLLNVESEGKGTETGFVIPTGVNLINKPNQASSSSSTPSSTSTKINNGNADDADSKKATSKPKWFKL